MRSWERHRRKIGRVSRALAWGVVSAAALAACSPPRPPAEGTWQDASSSKALRPAARSNVRWDLEGQLRALRPAGKRGRSEHLGGDREGEILASPGTPYPPRGPTPLAAAGTTVIERLFQAGAAQPEVYFVMVKRAPGYDPPEGDWEFLVVSPDGLVEAPSPLPLCARCHAEAPHDHLFGGAR